MTQVGETTQAALATCMIDHSKLSEGCCGQSYTLQELPVLSLLFVICSCLLNIFLTHAGLQSGGLMTDVWGSDLCDALQVSRVKQACLTTLATCNTLMFACYQLQQMLHLSQDYCMLVSWSGLQFRTNFPSRKLTHEQTPFRNLDDRTRTCFQRQITAAYGLN
jgi:hypothetical protein